MKQQSKNPSPPAVTTANRRDLLLKNRQLATSARETTPAPTRRHCCTGRVLKQ